MILVALAYVLHPVLAAGQEPDWSGAPAMPPVVKRALESQPHWRFTGTRIVTVKRRGEVSEHTEYLTRDGWNLRIEFPGESRYSGNVIVETPTERRSFNPRKNEIHVTPPRREKLFEHLRGAWRGQHAFRVVDEGGDRIAGFATRLVKVLDGSGNRIQELNIEPKTGIVLARRLYDDVGTLEGAFEFREINLHPAIDPAEFVLKRKGVKITTPVDDLHRVVTGTSFIPVMPPPTSGFILDSASVHDIEGQHALMCQYDSREGRIIVFQFSAGVDPNKLQHHAPKEVHAATAQIEGHWVVAVGPQREAVLRSILKAMHPVP